MKIDKTYKVEKIRLTFETSERKDIKLEENDTIIISDCSVYLLREEKYIKININSSFIVENDRLFTEVKNGI